MEQKKLKDKYEAMPLMELFDELCHQHYLEFFDELCHQYYSFGFRKRLTSNQIDAKQKVEILDELIKNKIQERNKLIDKMILLYSTISDVIPEELQKLKI